MNERGPVSGGRRWDGAAYAYTRYSYRYQDIAGGLCKVSEADVEVEATVTLPRWEGARDGDPTLQESWEAFLEALIEHEEGHVRIAERHADRLHRELLRMSGLCRGLQRDVRDLARERFRESRAAQVEYDRETRHGAEQGVRLANVAPSDVEFTQPPVVPGPPSERPRPDPEELGSIPYDGPGEFLTRARSTLIAPENLSDRCLQLPWWSDRGLVSDHLLEIHCETEVPLVELGVGAGTLFRARTARWQSIFGAVPGLMPADSAMLPDTLPELELIVLADVAGMTRPVWHDRVDTRRETVGLPRIIEVHDLAFLVIEYCLVENRGCRTEFYRIVESDAWLYVKQTFGPELQEALPAGYEMRGGTRVDLATLRAITPLWAVGGEDPTRWAITRLRLNLGRLEFEGLEVVDRAPG